jgi:hypothetical protein
MSPARGESIMIFASYFSSTLICYILVETLGEGQFVCVGRAVTFSLWTLQSSTQDHSFVLLLRLEFCGEGGWFTLVFQKPDYTFL